MQSYHAFILLLPDYKRIVIAKPEDVNRFDHTSPAMMAQFANAGLKGIATILVYERKQRILSRMLTVNLSRGIILPGHYPAMFLMILFQLVILIFLLCFG